MRSNSLNARSMLVPPPPPLLIGCGTLSWRPLSDERPLPPRALPYLPDAAALVEEVDAGGAEAWRGRGASAAPTAAAAAAPGRMLPEEGCAASTALGAPAPSAGGAVFHQNCDGPPSAGRELRSSSSTLDERRQE
jgi:hypothetical protein